MESISFNAIKDMDLQDLDHTETLETYGGWSSKQKNFLFIFGGLTLCGFFGYYVFCIKKKEITPESAYESSLPLVIDKSKLNAGVHSSDGNSLSFKKEPKKQKIVPNIEHNAQGALNEQPPTQEPESTTGILESNFPVRWDLFNVPEPLSYDKATYVKTTFGETPTVHIYYPDYNEIVKVNHVPGTRIFSVKYKALDGRTKSIFGYEIEKWAEKAQNPR